MDWYIMRFTGQNGFDIVLIVKFLIMNPLKPLKFRPSDAVKVIRRHPKGITQQDVLKATVKGYKGSKFSNTYSEYFRALEDAGYIRADRRSVKRKGNGRTPRECQRVIKWYPNEWNTPLRKRDKIKDFVNIHLGIQI